LSWHAATRMGSPFLTSLPQEPDGTNKGCIVRKHVLP
jgi:hypothetical protein